MTFTWYKLCCLLFSCCIQVIFAIIIALFTWQIDIQIQSQETKPSKFLRWQVARYPLMLEIMQHASHFAKHSSSSNVWSDLYDMLIMFHLTVNFQSLPLYKGCFLPLCSWIVLTSLAYRNSVILEYQGLTGVLLQLLKNHQVIYFKT